MQSSTLSVTSAKVHLPSCTTTTALAASLSTAILHGDMPLAVQLAWRLIFQPDCPLRMQTQAILVHSALSLRLGADPGLIANNLRVTIHRIAGGTELSRLALRGHMMPWKLEALAHLNSALRSVRMHGDIPFRALHSVAGPCAPARKLSVIPEHLSNGIKSSTCPEHLADSMKKIELDHIPENVDVPRYSGDVE